MNHLTPRDTAYRTLTLMCALIDTIVDDEDMLLTLDETANFSEMSRSELLAAVDALTDLFGDVCVAIRRETGSAALVARALHEGGFRGWRPSQAG